jgi:hypothetical protein
LSLEHDPSRERRASVRIAPKGSAIVTAPSWIANGRITNISIGGVAVALDGSTLAAAGDAVEIDLRLDGPTASWLERLTGKVARVDAATLVIEFDDEPFALTQLIAETSHNSRSRSRRIWVILVDSDVDRRLAIGEGFRRAGCVVMAVATPLEAIVRLGESMFEPDVIAISDSLPTTISDELRRFVDHAHPKTKLLRIGAEGADQALSWTSSRDDLLARIRVVLGGLAR